uniref:Tetratricopeptide repeat protein 13 n=1 Tax=Phallusia mammillata TaxID=59560 RepID=A0A6F9DV55_9ASCI|nr:tetratricopeptide repeat protein 13 [Phallusia mammillata]
MSVKKYHISVLLWLYTTARLSLTFGSDTETLAEVTICDFGSTSKDCDIEKGLEWELHTNLCKDIPVSCQNEVNGPIINSCAPEDLDYKKIEQYANQVMDRHMVPMVCSTKKETLQMSIGIVLLKSNYPDVAVGHYSEVIKKQGDSPCAALYYGRGMAYSKLGLEDPTYAAHALSDYTKALHAAGSRDTLQIYETRADAFSSLGQYAHALDDYTEAIKLAPSYRMYLMRGISLVFLERYQEAYKDLQESLRLQPHQITAMHYLTTCLYNMRQFDEAITIFKSILALKPDHGEVMQSLAQTYREVGNFQLAIDYYTKAITHDQTNSVLYQRKAMLLYNTGRPQEALDAFRTCATLDPFNEMCKFMKGACYAAMGQFYPAIKEMTKATTERPVQQPKGQYTCPTTMFLREWCRYVHSHLDTDVQDFTPDNDLPPGFKENWSYDVMFSVQNYTEQPGLQPRIKDISAPSWDQMSGKRRRLLCYAHTMGKTLSAQSLRFADAYIENPRANLIAGLASLEVAQTAAEFWAAPKSYRNKHGKKFTWRDAFDISVKWYRFIDPNRPLFWMDDPNPLSKPFTLQEVIMQNSATRPRYEKYLLPIYKLLAHESTAPGKEFSTRGNTDPAESFQHLLDFEKKRKKTSDPFIVAISKVASKKERTQKTLDGCNIVLQFDRNHRITLVLDSKLTWPKAKQYHSELDFLWQKIADEHKRLSGKSNGTVNATESLINLILSLTYYFLNLMPISKCTTSVAYSTAVGLLFALGREATGKIPKGREIFLDAVTIFDPEKFKSTTRSWLSFKKIPNSASHLEKVAEAFPTYRSMFEVLHLDLSNLCASA